MNDREIEALEQEAETTRTRVSGLLDELRGRVSPGEMVDQMVSYAGDGAGEFVRTLGNQLRNNPLPAMLIGVGVAWLMFSDKRPRTARAASSASSRNAVRDTTERARGLVADAGERIASVYGDAGTRASEMAARTTDTVNEYGQQAVDTAYEMGARVSDTASELGHRARDTAQELRHRASDTASSVARRATEAGHTMEEMSKRALNTASQILHEQPLVAAGIGLAIGAALGAALPATETENKLMGSTADDLKERARQAASEQYEHVRETAQDVYGTVVDTVAREVAEGGTQSENAFDERVHEHGPRPTGG